VLETVSKSSVFVQTCVVQLCILLAENRLAFLDDVNKNLKTGKHEIMNRVKIVRKFLNSLYAEQVYSVRL